MRLTIPVAFIYKIPPVSILLSIFYAVLRCINSMWKRRRIIRKRQNYDDKEILIKKLIVIDFVNLQKGANNKCEKVRVGANY